MNIISTIEDLELQGGEAFYQTFSDKSIAFGEFIDGKDSIIDFHKRKPEECESLLRTFLKKRTRITQLRVFKAIEASLYNCRLDTKKTKTKESQFNPMFMTEDDGALILSKYRTTTRNPLVFAIDPENISQYKSIIDSKDSVAIRYGKYNNGAVRITCLTDGWVSPINITAVNLLCYHPIIWYLLREDKLKYYITSYKKWRSERNTISKQRKTKAD